ncbi:hypothetical protein RD055328_01350 [Companilactobacillus sp. RD055328]|uniref:hypothetical protein n=1 Tax=Companilactobacillus sp. RD055328 TaxID=2916634 RepID=UPI001FC7F06A|nr:hypothetical protein [Companilactobacillus sp. RD055328]GKQ42212.1 hypothetical protein RD055328_01350 [Companilactobacillus sp. RD055328]
MLDYTEYLKKKDAMSFEEALDIYNSIFEALENQDEYLHELWEEVINSILAYSKMRTNWNYFSREEKMEKDPQRTGLHNQFITNLKAFHRLTEQLGINGDWMTKLGPSEDRKRWGDFAGYILCFENIKAR